MGFFRRVNFKGKGFFFEDLRKVVGKVAGVGGGMYLNLILDIFFSEWRVSCYIRFMEKKVFVILFIKL